MRPQHESIPGTSSISHLICLTHLERQEQVILITSKHMRTITEAGVKDETSNENLPLYNFWKRGQLKQNGYKKIGV